VALCRLREPVRADPQARPVVSDPSTNFLIRYNDLSVQRRMVCSLITSDGGRVDRRKPILNRSEAAAESALQEAAKKNDARVFTKVRIADALSIDQSGLPGPLWRYALQGHFDFLLADMTSSIPHFAVEFDGPSHWRNPDTMRRDAMKNMICERLRLPLLRVDAGYLRSVRRFTLIDWLVELWFIYEEFCAMQERGEIPYFEPFMYFSLFEPTPDGRRSSYGLSDDARTAIWLAWVQGICPQLGPEEVSTRNDEESYSVAHAILPLTGSGTLVGSARCRSFHFPPVSPRELAGELAMVDLGDKLRRYQQDAFRPTGEPELAKLREETAGWIREGVLLAPAAEQQSY
jgi:Protein of unknown function (DUF2726)